MPDNSGLEYLIKVQRSRAFPSQAGHREVAAAISTAMVGQDVVLGFVLGLASGRTFRGGLGERERTRTGIDHKSSDCDQEEQMSVSSDVQLRPFKMGARAPPYQQSKVKSELIFSIIMSEA